MTTTDPRASELRGPDGDPIRVLVVDDEQTLSELVGLALRYEGWEVRTAADGSCGDRAAREFRPDPVVLDVMLPDIDGLEVLAAGCADIDRMPVLFLTARDDVERPHRRAHRRRRRLRHQAVLASRNWCCGCGPCCAVAPGSRTTDSATIVGRRPGAGRGLPGGAPRRRLISLTATEFELLRFLMRNPSG